MEQPDTYLSIAGETSSVFRDKASKFIAYAIPASTEDDVREHLARLRKEHYAANHHCYAYRIGFPDYSYRFNDDGEPSGSAGKPIYGQILSAELSDILVIVVRYFGGTKLGIPGLIHAYKTSAREAIDKAPELTKTLEHNLSVHFRYPQMNDVMRILKQEEVTFVDQTFANDCKIHFAVRRSKSRNIKDRLSLIQDIYVYELFK